MASGYGSRIYKNRERTQLKRLKLLLLLFFAVIILMTSVFIRNRTDTKNNSGIKGNSTENKKKNSENLYSKYRNAEVSENIVEKANKISGDSTEKETTEKNSNISVINVNLIKANEMFSLGDYNKALFFFRIAEKSKKSLLTWIGICYFKLGSYKESKDLLKKAKEEDYYPFLTRKFLAYSLYQLNEIEKARENIEEALDMRDDSELQSLYDKIKREKSVMRDYKEQNSGKFTVQFSRTEHTDIRDIVIDYMKEAYREIGRETDIYPSEKIVIILYNEKSFFDVTRAPGWAGGLFDGKIRIPIGGVKDKLPMLKRVLFHEYTHVLVSLITGKCPLWLNEGLAEYFSEERGTIPVIGQVIPLNMLENRFPSGNPKAVRLAYIESYSAVLYLIEKYGFFSIRELLNSLNTKNIDEAFKSVFYISYKDFLRKWGRND